MIFIITFIIIVSGLITIISTDTRFTNIKSVDEERFLFVDWDL